MNTSRVSRQQVLRKQFTEVNKRIQKLNVRGLSVANLSSVQQLRRRPPNRALKWILKVNGFVALLLASLCCFICVFQWPMSTKTLYRYVSIAMRRDMETSCLIGINNEILMSVRPALDCDVCKGIFHIDTVRNISTEELMSNYINPIRPVLIKEAFNLTKTGVTFDFDFFKNLYRDSHSTLKNKHPLCEFERFLTTANTVGELLSMRNEAVYSPGGEDPLSWYVGWINCDRDVTRVLSGYFLPTFFPVTTELSKRYWIYMGSPKHGFTMHIDPAFEQQWQTQVYGRKRFTFMPPPECYFECHYEPMDVTMELGDTLIFHAGIWYHETENIGDTVMVSIGTSFT